MAALSAHATCKTSQITRIKRYRNSRYEKHFGVKKLRISAVSQGSNRSPLPHGISISDILGALSGVLDCGHHVAIENLPGDPALPIARVHPRV